MQAEDGHEDNTMASDIRRNVRYFKFNKKNFTFICKGFQNGSYENSQPYKHPMYSLGLYDH